MRRMFFSSTLLAALYFTVVVSVRAVHSQSKPKLAAKAVVGAPAVYGNMDSISEDEMKIYLYFLASDQLEGRNLPSRGFDTAALYVASHLAEWGLKPGGSTTKTNGPLQPYLMPFELVSKQWCRREQGVDHRAGRRLRARRAAAEGVAAAARGGAAARAANHRLRIHQGLDRRTPAAVAPRRSRRSTSPAIWFSPATATSSTRPKSIRTKVST